MDFNQLMSKMRELDQPVSETPAAECGEPMGMTPPVAPQSAPVNPPSMSVNLNAQGMDNIEDLLKLITKVNPDMEKPAMPPMGMPGLPPMGGPEGEEGGMPKIMSIKPINKLLPDFDADNDEKPGGEKDIDMDDKGDMDDKDEKEEFANEPDEKYNDTSIIGGNDLNKEKGTFPKVAGGDNPMQKVREGDELRASIRAELLRRLEEAKGAK